MPYTTREAIVTLSTYLGINLGVSVRSIDQTSNRGYEIRLPSGERCVIFVYPISHKQDDSKNFFDTRDSGARERGITWNYAQTRNLKYFCLAVHDQVDKYKDYIFSLECDEHRIAEVSGTLNGSRNGRGTQVVIPTSCVPSKDFERIYTDNGFYIAVIHKDHIYAYLEQYDNRPYMDKTLPLIDADEVEDDGETDVSPDEMKREFEDFLTNVAKNRKGMPLAPTSIRNCLSNLQKNMAFLEKFKCKNVYEISSVDLILLIQQELSKNNDYIEEDKDKAKGNGYYSHSLEQYKKFLIYRKEIKIDLADEIDEETELKPFKPSQIIYYGVPGCGKSNKIKEDLNDVPEYNKIRVVFHPEYTNADFMGQILPVVNGGISYKFTPGPFAQIIKRAYLNPNDKFYLVIEEINRGNAAAIFGDTFQLLDRLKPGKTDSLGNDPASPNVNTFTEGWSQYFVQNIDVNDYIRNVVEDNGKYKEPSDLSNTSRLNIKIGCITFTKNTAIRLPPNLSILATMNTSDQNVFTLDNAFQRRFDMQLVRNEFEKDESQNQFGGYKDADVQKQHDATIAGTNVKWGDFWAWINNKIVTTLKGLSSTEDKRLGVWFVSNVDGKIDEKVFAEKVLKYLWDDAFKFKRPQIFAPEIDTLERLIAAFEKPDSGKNRFEVFKDFSNLMSSVAAPPQNNGAANS